MPRSENPPILDPAVREVFDGFADDVRTPLFRLRSLIFEVARETPAVGRLEETLKWGQPAYLTSETKSGTTIRLGTPRTGGYGLFVHCQSRIIPEFRALFPRDWRYDGNRGVVFAPSDAVDETGLKMLILSALTYRLKPNSKN